ncbi:MAG: prohibitin family protein [Myxococcales bacterium]
MKDLLVVGAVALSVAQGCACYTVEPGTRGVKVTLGEVSPSPLPEGWGFKAPFATDVIPVSVRQQTRPLEAACFSSDLQQVTAKLQVLYRLPEGSVVRVYRDYAGEPFDALIAPRVHEALKEVTAQMTAEQIAKQRESAKTKSLELARKKVGELLILEDLVIEDIALSDELERAIEQKMVQEQEAAKAKFIQQKAEIEAQTAIVKAKGEAEAIRIRGEALKATPSYIELQIVEKWDGKSPLVVGAGQSANILLPMAKPDGDGRR